MPRMASGVAEGPAGVGGVGRLEAERDPEERGAEGGAEVRELDVVGVVVGAVSREASADDEPEDVAVALHGDLKGQRGGHASGIRAVLVGRGRRLRRNEKGRGGKEEHQRRIDRVLGRRERTGAMAQKTGRTGTKRSNKRIGRGGGEELGRGGGGGGASREAAGEEACGKGSSSSSRRRRRIGTKMTK